MFPGSGSLFLPAHPCFYGIVSLPPGSFFLHFLKREFAGMKCRGCVGSGGPCRDVGMSGSAAAISEGQACGRRDGWRNPCLPLGQGTPGQAPALWGLCGRRGVESNRHEIQGLATPGGNLT